jgi:4-hydroxy-4-methyl-2-oxoglutarate aldolase
MKTAKREELLTLYNDLRICDVRDAMDALGYFHYGSLNASVRPLWRTRAYGLARTVRYLPYIGPAPQLTAIAYRSEWTSWYYENICPYPWQDDLEAGDFVVIDQSGMNVGLMGSENSLKVYNKGARGIVTNGGVRDTDEIIMEKVPFWSQHIGQTMVQVRLQFDSKNIPVAVGGVQIRPEDMVVADGDGVIVVPHEVVEQVAYWAHEEHERDKQTRREHYRQAGLEFDSTV